MTFAIGSLVKARGREWVLLPESEGDLLTLRPLGGADVEIAGIYLPLEPVEPEDELHLTRTHPFVENLAGYVMDTALDPVAESAARRAGAIRTRQVAMRTTLLLVRFRYHILTRTKETTRPLLAEEVLALGFTGAPQNAVWLPPEQAEALLLAEPDANINPQQATQFVQRVVDGFADLHPHLETVASERAAELLAAHQRVRTAARMRGVRYAVEPKLPPDVLGIYVYLPQVFS